MVANWKASIGTELLLTLLCNHQSFLKQAFICAKLNYMHTWSTHINHNWFTVWYERMHWFGMYQANVILCF